MSGEFKLVMVFLLVLSVGLGGWRLSAFLQEAGYNECKLEQNAKTGDANQKRVTAGDKYEKSITDQRKTIAELRRKLDQARLDNPPMQCPLGEQRLRDLQLIYDKAVEPVEPVSKAASP